MDNGIEIKEERPAELSDAVSVIKNAILQSQARAARGVNQEQLALTMALGGSFRSIHASGIGAQGL